MPIIVLMMMIYYALPFMGIDCIRNEKKVYYVPESTAQLS